MHSLSLLALEQTHYRVREHSEGSMFKLLAPIPNFQLLSSLGNFSNCLQTQHLSTNPAIVYKPSNCIQTQQLSTNPAIVYKPSNCLQTQQLSTNPAIVYKPSNCRYIWSLLHKPTSGYIFSSLYTEQPIHIHFSVLPKPFAADPTSTAWIIPAPDSSRAFYTNPAADTSSVSYIPSDRYILSALHKPSCWYIFSSLYISTADTSSASPAADTYAASCPNPAAECGYIFSFLYNLATDYNSYAPIQLLLHLYKPLCYICRDTIRLWTMVHRVYIPCIPNGTHILTPQHPKHTFSFNRLLYQHGNLDKYGNMERLDEGHFHPLLEHPRQTIFPAGVWIRDLSTARRNSSKELFEQLFICNWEPLHHNSIFLFKNVKENNRMNHNTKI